MQPIEWTTVKRKIDDLIRYERNPRKLTYESQKRLESSLLKFNLAEIPIINRDNTLIGGNQRVLVLQLLGRGEEEIDVRYPNRQLTDSELKEYVLTSNTHAGEWDYEMLNLEFCDFDLREFNIVIPDLNMDESFNGYEYTSSLPSKPIAPTRDTIAATPPTQIEYKFSTLSTPSSSKPTVSPIIPTRWFLYIDCVTEKEAEKMYNELTERGFETKIIN